MNLDYDLKIIRACLPSFRKFLYHRSHTLVDLSVCNALQCVDSPEKSLKTIGPALGLWRYERTLKDGDRFDSPLDPAADVYCCSDSWNAVLGIAEFASLIEAEYPETDKLSPYGVTYYSNLAWDLIVLGENGTPVSLPKLLALRDHHRTLAASSAATLKEKFALSLTGKGSPAAKTERMERVFAYIDQFPSVCQEYLGSDSVFQPELHHSQRLVEITKAKKQVSATEVNRKLALALLEHCPQTPETQEHVDLLTQWTQHDRSGKMVGTFCRPLLDRYDAKEGKCPFSRRLLRPYSTEPLNPAVRLAFPSWFLVPSSVKDDAASEGGQRQARPASADPHVQQWPAELKACVHSRFEGGSVESWDASQIELRVPGVLSAEPTLVREYAKPKPDLHTARCIDVFGPTIVDDPHFKSGDMRTDPRQWAKKFNFEDLYWAGARKMLLMLLKDSGRLFPLSFFQKVEHDRPYLRPRLYDWQRDLIRTTQERGYYALPLTGISRSFVLGPDSKPNEILNLPIQANAAITLISVQQRVLSRLAKYRTKVLPFINWFDALIFDVAPGYFNALRDAFDEAVRFVSTQGYWARLCSLPGHAHVPLVFEHKTLQGGEQ